MSATKRTVPGTMVEGISEAYDAGIPAGQYNYDTETGEVSRHRTVTWMEILIAVILAVGSGAAVYAAVVGRYRLRFGGYQMISARMELSGSIKRRIVLSTL